MVRSVHEVAIVGRSRDAAYPVSSNEFEEERWTDKDSVRSW